MTDPTQTDPAPAPEPNTFYEEPVWKRFYAFLLGPALIAAAVVAVFTIADMLIAEEDDPVTLVKSLQDGGEHSRWQAAFALTRYLQPSVQPASGGLQRENDTQYQERLRLVQVLLPDLLQVWNDPVRGDPQVRRFLALAFGYLGDPRVLPALQGVLTDSDPELVHYALAAVATTLDLEAKVPGAAPPASDALLDAVLVASQRPEPDIRATGVYVLGVVGGPRVVERLHAALADPAPAVAWNAAFALARQKDGAGESVIAEILDRGPLFEAAGPDRARQSDLFLNAVRSAGMVATPALRERLSRVAKSDENLAARNLAIELIQRPAEEG